MALDTILLYVVAVAVIFGALQGAFYLAGDLREETLRAAANVRRPKLADGVAPWLRDLLLTTPVRRFDNVVQTCGIKARTDRVLVFMMLASALAMGGAELYFDNIFRSLSLGLGLGFGLPFQALMFMRSRRMKKLTAQLPEALDMMVRSLKAGHPIPASISIMAKGMADPIGSEFKMVYDATTFGLSLRDALMRMTERLHTVKQLRFLVSAINIQATAGGNLADILGSLAKLMREQERLHLKIKAISAEGRLGGMILAALPVVLAIAISFLRPAHYAQVHESTGLMMTMGLAAFLLVLGVGLIRRIVNFKV